MKNIDHTRVVRLQDMPTGGSDLVLKKDVTALQDVLQKVLSLRPVTWRWKAGGDSNTTQYGFIAQEVEQLFPDVIKDGVWHGEAAKVMSTHDLLPYAIEAIKEQQATIESAQKQLDSLQDEVKRLHRQLGDS
ncbi:MAG TPA: tail fiber domain-containing protein [Candidatus Saccharimonadales bacterium]|nr:tail fiber domain-containing protein [Candidatus Saccharimonadales bacterium]